MSILSREPSRVRRPCWRESRRDLRVYFTRSSGVRLPCPIRPAPPRRRRSLARRRQAAVWAPRCSPPTPLSPLCPSHEAGLRRSPERSRNSSPYLRVVTRSPVLRYPRTTRSRSGGQPWSGGAAFGPQEMLDIPPVVVATRLRRVKPWVAARPAWVAQRLDTCAAG